MTRLLWVGNRRWSCIAPKMSRDVYYQHRSHFDSNIRCRFVQSGFHSLENILQGFVCPCLLICRWRPLLFRSMGILLSFLMKMCRSLSLGQEKYVKTINQAHVLFLRSRLLSFLGFFFVSLPQKKRKKKKRLSAFRNLGMLFTSPNWQDRDFVFHISKTPHDPSYEPRKWPAAYFFNFFWGVGLEGEAWPGPE